MIDNKKALCFGEVLWDMLPTGRKAGGAPMNVALHLHKIGAEVGLVARVGNDELGKDLVTFIDNFGLDTSMLQLGDKWPTSQVLVHLDEHKNATYEICTDVAWDNIQLTEENIAFAKQAGVIIYGSLASRFETTRSTLISLLDASEALKVMDVNLRPPFDTQAVVEELLHKTDLAKVNEDELPKIAGWHGITSTDDKVLMTWMAKHYNCKAVCVTKGAAGAALLMNDTFVSHQGFKIELADSVGAGDAFLGGLISAIIEGKEAQDAITYASALGAYVASREGATPEYDKEAIAAILAQ